MNQLEPDGWATTAAGTEIRPRPRSLGVRFGELPTGALNAITDLQGVLVGHVALRGTRGDASLCTGVTAVLPRSRALLREKVIGAVHAINAFGKPTGVTQVNELGVIETPIVLTNTLSVGAAYTGVVMWALEEGDETGHGKLTVNPLVFECNDGWLNDIRSLAIHPHHVLEAIRSASDRVTEGSVGAGAGMMCYGWKGGIGTASRVIDQDAGYIVGALVLANFGTRRELVIGGVPVGTLLPADGKPAPPDGSCIVVLATDAPLDAIQLRRLAARAQYGLGRTGTFGHHGSGDYAVAVSTAKRADWRHAVIEGSSLDPFFQAAVETVEESIVNALFAGETVTGVDRRVGHRLPVERTLELILNHGHAQRS